MEVIILAGGMGKRLKKVISNIPKPMAPVGGKPFLYYLLQWLNRFRIEKIILSAGYKGEVIKDFFGNSAGTIPLEYIIEEKPLGTGGAVIRALEQTSGEDVLIINGDTWFPIDINRFYTNHLSYNSLFSIALKRMQRFSRYGSVECSEDRIIRFIEKKYCDDGLINGGIYLANRRFFNSRILPEVFSLEKDLLEKETGSSVLRGFVFEEQFIDIGVPEDYYRAQSLFLNS